jgi:hypothetical protein
VPKSSYPVVADLTSYATAAGLTLDSTQAGNAVLAGIQEFQTATGRHFLAGKSITGTSLGATTRTLRAETDPAGLVLFRGDLSAAPSAVVYTSSLGATPETWTVNEDYALGPYGALDEGRPYEWIELNGPYAGGMGSTVAITGLWGYGATIPDDAWQAMLVAGLLYAIEANILSLTGVSMSWSREGVSESYGASGAQSRIAGWRALRDRTVARYRKLGV